MEMASKGVNSNTAASSFEEFPEMKQFYLQKQTMVPRMEKKTIVSGAEPMKQRCWNCLEKSGLKSKAPTHTAN
jgi:hypothetical protein